ncbi:hypothetical protein TSAR_012157 [Trichomalopsis sarcophagae]|uniref:CCHC-type domain-containing protein n=1 Tax=Trichomalopsis sarcophagae TaxID=543379 RepID=A0A232FKS7_9HYME|nr:hypothetical protein TSAR_012157 [Trichomalopsis sarcophagae]
MKELKRLEGTAEAELKRFKDELDAEAERKCKKGLKSEVKYELGQENTVEDISKVAIEIENYIKKETDIYNGIVNNVYEDYEREVEQTQKVLACQILQNCPNVVCKRCNKKGHTIKYCKAGEGKSNFRICAICETVQNTKLNSSLSGRYAKKPVTQQNSARDLNINSKQVVIITTEVFRRNFANTENLQVMYSIQINHLADIESK